MEMNITAFLQLKLLKIYAGTNTFVYLPVFLPFLFLHSSILLSVNRLNLMVLYEATGW